MSNRKRLVSVSLGLALVLFAHSGCASATESQEPGSAAPDRSYGLLREGYCAQLPFGLLEEHLGAIDQQQVKEQTGDVRGSRTRTGECVAVAAGTDGRQETRIEVNIATCGSAAEASAGYDRRPAPSSAGRSGPLDALAGEFDSISWDERSGRYDIFVLDANVVANVAIEPVGGTTAPQAALEESLAGFVSAP